VVRVGTVIVTGHEEAAFLRPAGLGREEQLACVLHVSVSVLILGKQVLEVVIVEALEEDIGDGRGI
jgi:hypothetical protein